MAFRHSEAERVGPAVSTLAPVPVKIVIAGGFGVGKTTFVGSISEIVPISTEAAMTDRAIGVDEGASETKSSTTVAMDFGRRTLGNDLVLYLFGTPGQDRFHFMWEDLSRGAIGAVVLVDTRRIGDCFRAIDFFEQHNVPFIVAVNVFDGNLAYELSDIRDALAIRADVPLVLCDARDRASTKMTLVELVQHALARS